MFCSDGVCGLINDDMIETALHLPDLNDAAERLVVESLHEGGIDNITVIVADVVEAGGATRSSCSEPRPSIRFGRHGAPRRQLAEDVDDPEDTLVTRLADMSRLRSDEERYSPQPPQSATASAGRSSAC